MNFKTIAEAFNYYKNSTVADLEKRAAELKGVIDTDANADVNAINIELQGIKEAKDNLEERSAGGSSYNILSGMGTKSTKKTFTSDEVLATPEYRSAFFKTLLGHTLNENEKEAFKVATLEAEKRADAFNSAADSLAVLPTQTLNEVVSKARTMGGLMAECRAFNVPSKIAIPIGTPGTKAAWHTEGETVETEKATLASVTFDGYEILKVFSISAKVRKMSIAAFEAYLTDELTACVMECIADALVNGTGSGQGTGLETITWTTSGTTQNAVAVAAGGEIEYGDVVKTVSLLKRGYSAGAKWAMNNATLYNVFYGMVDSNGQPIFISDPKSEQVGKILGFEVVIDDNIANNAAYFGNFKKYLGYNMPEGIAIEASTQSSFKKGLIDYRALAVADCKPIITDAFIKLYIAAA